MTLQHLRSGGLLLQRLVGALQLVEQPRVLDGDDRLVGEGGHQLDLFVGETVERSLRLDDNDADRHRPRAAAARRACVRNPPSSAASPASDSPDRRRTSAI